MTFTFAVWFLFSNKYLCRIALEVELLNVCLLKLQKMVCHGEHTYLYTQVMMSILCLEQKGGSNIRRLCQEINQSAKQRSLNLLFHFILQLYICLLKFTTKDQPMLIQPDAEHRLLLRWATFLESAQLFIAWVSTNEWQR